MIEVDRIQEPWESDAMENLRWSVGPADALTWASPHHVSVMIESAGQSAVITGDVMHHPCQIAYPDWAASDFDPDQAQTSRSDLLNRFADTDTLIIGTHFADPVAGRIRREGTAYRLIGLRQPIGTDMPMPPRVSAP
jgi:glyoxylase-like metal-dependent hydrolase (beta-lactamase superfamily II)